MGDLTPRLGVICGMMAEARLLRGLGLMVRVTGARPDQASAAARELVRLGCDRLVSFGVAGGLDPALTPGDLVLARAVVWPGGRLALATPWPGAGGVCLGAEAMVLTAQQKSALFATTGAVVVDMETHPVAQVGAETGVPVAVLRAVGDPAGRDLPDLVLGSLDAQGRPRLGPVLRGLACRPGALPGLLRLKRDTDAGLARLRGAVHLLRQWQDGDAATI